MQLLIADAGDHVDDEANVRGSAIQQLRRKTVLLAQVF